MVVRASLRVMGAGLDPALVSALLETEPTEQHLAGDANVGQEGRIYAPYKEGLWSLSSAIGEESPLEEHILDLLDRINSQPSRMRELRNLGFRIDVFVGLFVAAGENPGVLLQESVLARLGDLGLALSLDIYGLS
jgi:hypothetical protein